MSFNPVEFITQVLKDHEISTNELFNGDYPRVIFGDVLVAEMQSEGGFEGGGEHASHVLQLTHPEHGVFYVYNCGSYDSYEGVDMDIDYIQVYPHNVMRVEYESYPQPQ